ncbi:unnamed protein product [Effrenium voratum]|nr:unnamed protein product [Effrenium voratum]
MRRLCRLVSWSTRMASDVGFALLPGVRTQQPRLPIEEELPIAVGLEARPPVTSPRSLRSGAPKLRTSPALSDAFQALLERLAQQHLLEMSVNESGGAMSPRSASAMSFRSRNSGASEAHSAAASLVQEDGEFVTEGMKRRRRVSVLMCKQHEGAQPVAFTRLMTKLEADVPPDSDSDVQQEDLTTAELEAPKPKPPCFKRLQDWLESANYELCVAFLLCGYVLWMAFELQCFGLRSGEAIGFLVSSEDWYHWHGWEQLFAVMDQVFTVIFALDVLIRIGVLGCKFWHVCMNYIDVMVTLVSLVEFLSFWALLADSNVNVNPVLFRLLRIGKMARAIRMVTMNSVLQSLQILTRCLVSSTNMLFWTFCLLTFFQCVAGMVAATLCRGFLEDESQDLGLRNEVFKYYGTFSRTILTMFEILFANWSPPCRVLVENISEYFSIFFLVYRCIIGFAVLNVVGAVFVQQTMKIASTDEQLAFKQKERELASYTRKVKKLFQTMDVSGDGTINFEEFSKLVQSPMLQFLLSQLDLEYHDLLSLFEFLDNGDGQITLAEFIDGAAKLRGNAKALDIWRIETKIEVFFGEVLAALRVETNVQQAFEQHNFKNVTLITESRRTVVPGMNSSERPPSVTE